MIISRKNVIKIMVSLISLVMVFVLLSTTPCYASNSLTEKYSYFNQTKSFENTGVGFTNKKGANNSLYAQASDKNSKYGIMNNNNFLQEKSNKNSTYIKSDSSDQRPSLFTRLKNRIISRLDKIENSINTIRNTISYYSPLQVLKRVWSAANLNINININR